MIETVNNGSATDYCSEVTEGLLELLEDHDGRDFPFEFDLIRES